VPIVFVPYVYTVYDGAKNTWFRISVFTQVRMAY